MLLTDINPSRRGDSNLSDDMDEYLVRMNDEPESVNSYRSTETQTSPEFVKESRRHAKRLAKLQKQQVSFKEQSFEKSLSRQHQYQLSPERQKLQRVASQNVDDFRQIHNTSIPSKRNIPVSRNEDSESNMESQDSQENGLPKQDSHDTIQQFAETLLRETAMKVQNDSFLQEDQFRRSTFDQADLKVRTEPQPLHPQSPSLTQLPASSSDDNLPPVNDKVSSKEGVIEDRSPISVANHISPAKRQPEQTLTTKAVVEAVSSKTPPIVKTAQIVPFKMPTKDGLTKTIQDKSLEALREGVNVPDKVLKLKWVYPFQRPNLRFFVSCSSK